MAICEKCIKKSVCKLCDGSEIMGCIEFVGKGKCVRASKGQELNCSEIPTGSIDYISKQEVVGLMMHIWGKNFSGDDAMQECIDSIRVMPPVTLQFSSSLEKNSQKLEKATTKNDLGVDVPDNNVGNIDCILRADAIKAIQKYGVGCLDADDFSPEQCERFVINKLNELHSVTPQEPRKAHWIHFASSDDCSKCGYSTGKYGSPSRYCPNCGADMREVEE